jgi:hypothetical protein
VSGEFSTDTASKEPSVTKDLIPRPHHVEPVNVVDAELVDEYGTCESAGFSSCPGGPAPLVTDPYDGDVNNTHRLAYLHDRCAQELAADI